MPDRPAVQAQQGTLLFRLLRAYVRLHWRGSTRCTFFLAGHLRSLRAVPILVHGTHEVFIDLRDGLSHDLLAGSPWPEGPWERDEQLIMRRLVRRNDTVLDVGCHIGLHTVLLSELVGPGGAVHGFEANPARLPALELTARAARNVIVHPFGLSDHDQRATLYVPDDQTMASLRNWTDERAHGLARRTPCELKALDPLIARGEVPMPQFIKCDIEGGERDMFAGAARTLNQAQAPILLYEANLKSASAFGCDISTATEFLKQLPAPGYSIAYVQPGGRLVPIDRFDPAHDHYNVVAVPRARLGDVRAAAMQTSSPAGRRPDGAPATPSAAGPPGTAAS